ncbi:hypothetical protein K450DRAFT_252535 [Umbelopsis ramanniana AG]|uniref:Uncharacterized protein n=1 Tax=Umbelopsis ramanniana AG TaxID=1314678 RepID=A0AAD5HCL6_UMBRA|nr:uncharacterized protein K450DRAFT_252535 [Umbelopsis ramanniana AG]KAI8577308.1 hypothetical protein K450DRAFT_252535 [Umbelopsis ramanniana AG]
MADPSPTLSSAELGQNQVHGVDNHTYGDEKATPSPYEGEVVSNSDHFAEKEPDQVLTSRNSMLGKLYQRFFSMGVEARGVERVLEDDRDPKNAINNLLMWFSVNTGMALS